MPPTKSPTKRTSLITQRKEELRKAMEEYAVSLGVSRRALRSKAERFSRISTFGQTAYGTFTKPTGDYGKFYTYGGLSYRSLRLAGKRALLIQAIHAVRKLQMLSIAKPVRDARRETGWRIVPDNFYDKDQKVSNAEEAQAKEIERWLLTPHAVHEPSLSDFFTRFINEHLTINRVAIELYKNQSSGQLQGFGLIDGAQLSASNPEPPVMKILSLI